MPIHQTVFSVIYLGHVNLKMHTVCLRYNHEYLQWIVGELQHSAADVHGNILMYYGNHS